jgi:hypothetical protein
MAEKEKARLAAEESASKAREEKARSEAQEKNRLQSQIALLESHGKAACGAKNWPEARKAVSALKKLGRDGQSAALRVKAEIKEETTPLWKKYRWAGAGAAVVIAAGMVLWQAGVFTASGTKSQPAVSVPSITSTPTTGLVHTATPGQPKILAQVTSIPTAIVAEIIPTLTFTPASSSAGSCDRAEYITDNSLPPYSIISAGEKFTKTWKFRNTGSCTWTTEYYLAFNGQDRLGGNVISFLPREVQPGQYVDIPVVLVAPLKSGKYSSLWVLKNANGDAFSDGSQTGSFEITIVVP